MLEIFVKVSLESTLRENARFNRFTTELITTRKFQCLYLWYSYIENVKRKYHVE